MLKKKEKSFRTIFIGVVVEVGLALSFIVAGAIITLLPYILSGK
ncbi:hypothetical protein Calow_0178 [Caldicellulosiruptor owensensis OL]|uniref:Uncharacterized protein n=1 Tax=Caldicellulosiruptor owensensis (strain ATCC 700167 / DSM 13100 / OL) TaxID=632518 RepID=E4Q2N1_CALOW|nr:hypothetical protein [Caldicellulosiruptor owensensis]ADQ03785.1 hypothetical protein Calow_0178 [Caldicellulosiruptor owensensis OL]